MPQFTLRQAQGERGKKVTQPKPFVLSLSKHVCSKLRYFSCA
jgi:hypothetical protein